MYFSAQFADTLLARIDSPSKLMQIYVSHREVRLSPEAVAVSLSFRGTVSMNCLLFTDGNGTTEEAVWGDG